MKSLASLLPSHDTASCSERFSRTATTHVSREALAGMTFVVVGAGALGNEVLKNLGLLGAGRVIVVDPDRIEVSNLSRSVFFRASDCGHFKAETMRVSLMSAFPDTQWESFDREIADVGYGQVAGCNLLLTCVDSDLARVESAWLAQCLDIPMVDGGLGGPDYWQGRVSFFAEGACFCCKLTPRRRWELLSLSLAAGHSCWKMPGTIPLPSTPIMASIIGAMQVDFGLQCLHERRNGSGIGNRGQSRTIEVSLGSAPVLRQFVTGVSHGCPFHLDAEQERFALPHPQATAEELLTLKEAQVVDLDWPICTVASCLECGSEWQPMRRVAWLRRHGACPQCAVRRILERETISTLDFNSKWIDTPMVALGLPHCHLYAVRRKEQEVQT